MAFIDVLKYTLINKYPVCLPECRNFLNYTAKNSINHTDALNKRGRASS